jgi:hypothetical protein
MNSNIFSAISMRLSKIDANQPILFVTEQETPIFMAYDNAIIKVASVVVAQMR